jgi:taurine dioxygenase
LTSPHVQPSPDFTVVPASGGLGADIYGIDVAKPVSQEKFNKLKRALLDYQVMFIRDQSLEPDTFLKFGKRWGGIHFYPYMKGLEGHPEIFEVIKNPGEDRTFGNRWHSDQMYSEKPCKFTILYARELPTIGGDTLFTNLYAAYEALSPGMKKLAGRLRTFNNGDNAKRYGGKSRDAWYAEKGMGGKLHRPKARTDVVAIHPLIRTHPDTRRKALYIGDQTERFDGMSETESQPLYDFFMKHASKDTFTCRLKWKPGTLAIWDNRCVSHYAISDYPKERRVMHRITIKDNVKPY